MTTFTPVNLAEPNWSMQWIGPNDADHSKFPHGYWYVYVLISLRDPVIEGEGQGETVEVALAEALRSVVECAADPR